jgi:hypothetical protein
MASAHRSIRPPRGPATSRVMLSGNGSGGGVPPRVAAIGTAAPALGMLAMPASARQKVRRPVSRRAIGGWAGTSFVGRASGILASCQARGRPTRGRLALSLHLKGRIVKIR